jgi:WD40 repeat protein
MSSLADLPEVVGFFSYSREDDEAFKGSLSALRDAVGRELAAQLGRNKRSFRLWQDQEAIAPGKMWEAEIAKAVEQAVFFIPIVTPRSVASEYCQFEFNSFLVRERALGRDDLVFPILYISVPALQDEVEWRNDPVLLVVGKRQHVDWRAFRHVAVNTPAFGEAIESFCGKVVQRLREPWPPPEGRRRQENETKSRVEEERRTRNERAREKIGFRPLSASEAPPEYESEPLQRASKPLRPTRRALVIGGLVGAGGVGAATVAITRNHSPQGTVSGPPATISPADQPTRVVGRSLSATPASSDPLIRTFTGHEGPIPSVAIAPDGHTGLSGSWDKTLKLWNLAGGVAIRTFTGNTEWVRSVAITPNGRSALSGSGQTLKLWDLSDGGAIRTFTGHTDQVWSVAIAPDGRTALSGSWDKTLKLWDLANGAVIRTFTGHTDIVTSVAIAPDGRIALSGSRDRTLRLWDLGRAASIRTFTDGGVAVGSVAIAPDGRTALSGSGDTLKLWALAGGTAIRTFNGHTDEVWSIAIAPDGLTALSGSRDTTLKLWDLTGGAAIRTFTGHRDGVGSVAIAPDGRTALSGSRDTTLKLWNLT